MHTSINWASFLSRSDLVWSTMPRGWDDGIMLGNGVLGTIFWQEADSHLHFEISRTDVYDHRHDDYSFYDGRCRLPNGFFRLQYGGVNPKGTFRLNLWDAEAVGTVTTDAGQLQLKAFTHAIKDVIVIEVAATGGEMNHNWEWVPHIAQSPLVEKPENYHAYPPQIIETLEGIQVSTQLMPESLDYNTQGKGEGQYATAWKVVDLGEGRKVIYLSETYSYPGTTAKSEAVRAVREAASEGITSLRASHQEWWHDFYPKSFLTLPDAKLESFYWIQMYKIASATREDRPVIDLQGPWYKFGGKWPGIWWNLNTQLAYWPFYVSNHNDLAGSLVNALTDNTESLAKNAGSYSADSYAIGRSCGLDLRRSVGTEAGNLPYALHNVWQQYKYTMDDELLRNRLLPLMEKSFQYFLHILVKDADGIYHLPATCSPEYTNSVDDSNYTLSLCRWLCSALIEADERLSLQSSFAGKAKDVLQNLTEYQVDETGFMVGKDMPFAESHRHWSHMFMIYPLFEFTYDNPEQTELIDRSLQHWLSLPEKFRGYSWLGAASMLAMAGNGNEALRHLNTFIETKPLPNAMYKEGAPVIETPLFCARTIQDMVLLSYNGIIRIFPGVPDAWDNVQFHDFLAEGAFRVSAKRENGATSFVHIQSTAGEPCRVKTGLSGPIAAHGDRSFQLTHLENGIVEIDLKKDERVVLYSGSTLPELTFSPVQTDNRINFWGTKS